MSYDVIEYNKVLATFDRQIEHEKQFTSNEKNCLSYWKKKLYIETRDFSIEDWKHIRSGNYWEEILDKSEIEKYKILSKRIEKYKK